MQARDVITRFIDVENSSEVVGLLQEFPDIQINYIEALLETELLDRDQRVPINLKNRYLELKCQMDPDQIVKALNRFKLPLDDSLKICKKYNQRHAIAHITYRLGLTKEAMDSYLEVTILRIFVIIFGSFLCLFCSSRSSKRVLRLI